ncbi:MAG: hypothetical protein LBD45_06950 [Bacteroidales bacterium]|jgi:hypothetical protein|nr:hypothetical protein [Bacteroidales bacterium]
MGKILKKHTQRFGITYIISVFAFFHGCGDTECTESTLTGMVINFHHNAGLQTPDSAFIYSTLEDTLLLFSRTGATKLNQLRLPLRINNSSTKYIFRLKYTSIEDEIDLIEFFHNNQPHFISETCGCAMFFTIDSVVYSKNAIDSILIPNREITNEPKENIQLFF